MSSRKRFSDSIITWKLIEVLNRTNSLTKASIELDIPLASTSKIISKLEKETRLKWVDHSLRPIRLTPFGRAQIPLIREMISAKARIELNVNLAKRTNKTKPIIFSLPSTSVSQRILSMLNQYKEMNLEVDIELRTDLDHLDVLNGKADIVLGSYSTNNLEVKEIPCGVCFNFLVASPKYLHKFGIPEKIEDLRDHSVILRKKEFYPVADQLQKKDEVFNLQTLEHYKKKEDGQRELLSSPKVDVNHKFKIIFAEDYPSYVLTVAGEGIAVDLPGSFIQSDIDKGILKPVLLGWHRKPWIKNIFIRRSEKRKEVIDFAEWFMQQESEDSSRRWKLAYIKNRIPFDSIDWKM